MAGRLRCRTQNVGSVSANGSRSPSTTPSTVRRNRFSTPSSTRSHSPQESVLDTLLHEIAHALAGHKAGHGPVWKAIAVRIGANPRACDNSEVAVVTPGDWQATCASCSKVFHRYQRPKSLTGYRCRCASRSPLTFEFMGDPALKPAVPPMTVREAANWEATCTGCGFVHYRSRRPKAGVWRCKCPQRSELTWRYRMRTSESTASPT
jgi:hypothetical protein